MAPDPDMALHLARLLDLAGVATFAATGALAAARRRHDIVTFIFFAAATGLGGGSLRDLLMGIPVFWMHDQSYLTVCAITAVAVWFLGAGPLGNMKALLWLDALGLAAYAVLGTDKALGAGFSGAIAVAMGILTSAFGGIVRDVLAGEPSVLLRREIYISAAFAGASIFAVLKGLAGLEAGISGAIAFTVAFAVRGLALIYGWSLPAFHHDLPQNR